VARQGFILFSSASGELKKEKYTIGLRRAKHIVYGAQKNNGSVICPNSKVEKIRCLFVSSLLVWKIYAFAGC